MFFVSVIDEKKFFKELQKCVLDVEKCIVKAQGEVSYLHKEVITSSLVQNYIFLSGSKFHNKIFKPIIIDSCQRAEAYSGQAGDICLFLSIVMLKRYIPQIRAGVSHRDIISSLSSALDESLEKLHRFRHGTTKDTIQSFLEQSIDKEPIRLIISEAIRLTGKNRKIIVKKSNSSHTRVEAKMGYNFPISVDSSFLNSSKRIIKKNPKVIVIDGAVIDVSEIHHLLVKSSETGDPYVIFAREFSNDVLNTLNVNLKRKTIDVTPIRIPLYEETINMMVDVAYACDTDVISSLKGELISSSVKEELATVDCIRTGFQHTTIENKSSSERVLYQIMRLEAEKNREHNTLKAKHFDKRIGSLTSGNVTIFIGTEFVSKYVGCIEKIDFLLRSLGSVIKFGFISLEELEKEIDSEHEIFLSKDLMSFLNKSNYKIIPVASLISAFKHSASTVSSIISSNYSIIEDI